MSARKPVVVQGDDASAIVEIFAQHLPAGCASPSARDIAMMVYLVAITRAAPRHVSHGAAHRALAGHVRGLLKLLPRLIREAEAEAARAHAAGYATDMDHFAERLQELYSASLAFSGITAPRNPRGWWHGWARVMRQTVDPVLRQCGVKQPGFGKATSPGVHIISDLLRLAGAAVDGDAIVSALEDRTKGGKLS